jgi:hypothetical protein
MCNRWLRVGLQNSAPRLLVPLARENETSSSKVIRSLRPMTDSRIDIDGGGYPPRGAPKGACSELVLRGRGDAFGCLVALARPVDRTVHGEALSDSHDF